MISVFEYATKTLHAEIIRSPFDSESSLPLYLKGLFDREKWTSFGTDFIVAAPWENLTVKTLAKHKDKLETISRLFAFLLNEAYHHL